MSKVRYIVFIVLSSVFISLSISCEKTKGCTDSSSLNYNADAEEDDGSCTYVADKLVGTWQVVETVTGSTVTFNEYYEAKIVKIDKDIISISAERDSISPYFYNNAQVLINWESKVLTGPYTMKGVITDENKITFDYVHDMNSSNPSIVKQEYTR